MTYHITPQHLGYTATEIDAEIAAKKLTDLGYPTEVGDCGTGDDINDIPDDIWNQALAAVEKEYKIRRYQIEYGKCKCTYSAERLRQFAKREGYEIPYDAYDYLSVAIKLFCWNHLMCSSEAHLNSVDVSTRGREYQEWQYQPQGGHGGWIYARTVEKA